MNTVWGALSPFCEAPCTKVLTQGHTMHVQCRSTCGACIHCIEAVLGRHRDCALKSEIAMPERCSSPIMCKCLKHAMSFMQI